jgi:hypothetical protein
LPVIGPVYRFTQASVHAPGFYAKASVAALAARYWELIDVNTRSTVLLVVLAHLACAVLLFQQFRPADRGAAPAGHGTMGGADLDILACATILLPAIMFLLARVATGSLNTRYFYSAVLGFSLLAVKGLRRLPYSDFVALGLLLPLMGYLTHDIMGRIAANRTPDARVAIVQNSPEQLPVVVTEASDFFELSESAPRAVRDRLVYVAMPAGLSSPDPEPELIAWRWKKVFSAMPVFHAEEWSARERRYYALCTSGSREGLTDWLIGSRPVSVALRTGSLWLLEIGSPQGVSR